MTAIPGSWLADSILLTKQDQTVIEGIKAAVRLYYQEYRGAVEVEPAMLAALVTIGDLVEEGVDLVPELIAEVQREITAQIGRTFTPPRES